MSPLTIRFKPGHDDAAQQCLDTFDRLDRKRKHPRVLATGIAENGGRTITVQFDDGLDHLAFLVAIGGVEIVTEEGAKP